MMIKSLWMMSIAALALAGCGGADPITGGKDKEDRPETGPTDQGEAEAIPSTGEGELIAAVRGFLTDKCAGCHGGGSNFGGITDIVDITELKRRNQIGANADSSPLFKLVSSKHQEGKTDPRTKKPVVLPSDTDIEFLREWINVGAPNLRGDRSVISLDTYLRRLRREASKFSRAEQNDLAVIDFHQVYNNERFSNAEMQAFANASLKLLNELDVFSTTANRAGIRVAFDDENLPIGIIFNPKRFNLDKQKDIVDTIVRLSNRLDRGDEDFICDIPSIPVLDFLHIASSDDVFNPLDTTFESGYSNIALQNLLEKEQLIAPDQLVFNAIPLAQFVQNGFTNIAVDIDVFDVLQAIDPTNFNRDDLRTLYNAGNDRERLVRACLLNSNVSAGNRCVDRLSQSNPTGGSTYLSWDILSVGDVNTFNDFFAAKFVGPANPPGDELFELNQDGFNPFVVDGGEGIFQLPNSMLGFFVYNGNFDILSNPPTYAVLNTGNLERGNFISASACTYCHQSYTIPFKDEIRNAIENSADGSEFGEAGFAFKISQSQENWDAQFALDSQYYEETLRNVYVARSESGELADGIWSLGSQYMNDLSNADIVAELGLLDEEDLKESINNITDLQGDLTSVFGGGMSRENFTINYVALVKQVAASNEDFLFGCVAREASDVGDFGDTDNGQNDGQNNGDD